MTKPGNSDINNGISWYFRSLAIVTRTILQVKSAVLHVCGGRNRGELRRSPHHSDSYQENIDMHKSRVTRGERDYEATRFSLFCSEDIECMYVGQGRCRTQHPHNKTAAATRSGHAESIKQRRSWRFSKDCVTGGGGGCVTVTDCDCDAWMTPVSSQHRAEGTIIHLSCRKVWRLSGAAKHKSALY